MFEYIRARKKFLFRFKLLSQVVDCLQLIHTIEKIANVFDNLLFFVIEL